MKVNIYVAAILGTLCIPVRLPVYSKYICVYSYAQMLRESVDLEAVCVVVGVASVFVSTLGRGY